MNGFSCRRRGFGGDQEEGSLKHYNKEAKNADKLVEYKNAAILFCTKTRYYTDGIITIITANRKR